MKLIKNFIENFKKANSKYTQEEYLKILNFYKNYHDFRTIHNCALETGLTEQKCILLKNLCYKNRDLGRYFFEDNANPQKYMKEYILKKTSIDKNANILEIGPGDNPVFDYNEYENWIGADKYFINDFIDFNGNKWSKNKYPKEKIYALSWENLNEIKNYNINQNFDLIVASHSYEHVFKPIQSLIEAADLLKANGYLVMFVPDGFSDELDSRSEMTHTLYIVPQMIEEFLHYSNRYHNIEIQQFRPNYDYVITAKKI